MKWSISANAIAEATHVWTGTNWQLYDSCPFRTPSVRTTRQNRRRGNQRRKRKSLEICRPWSTPSAPGWGTLSPSCREWARRFTKQRLQRNLTPAAVKEGEPNICLGFTMIYSVRSWLCVFLVYSTQQMVVAIVAGRNEISTGKVNSITDILVLEIWRIAVTTESKINAC